MRSGDGSASAAARRSASAMASSRASWASDRMRSARARALPISSSLILAHHEVMALRCFWYPWMEYFGHTRSNQAIASSAWRGIPIGL